MADRTIRGRSIQQGTIAARVTTDGTVVLELGGKEWPITEGEAIILKDIMEDIIQWEADK